MDWHTRGALALFALASACTGCGEASPDDSGAGPVAPNPLQLGPAASIPELEPGELCFRVDPALEVAYPTIRAAATEALARWGWELRFDDACDSALSIGAMRQNPDGAVPSAVHRPLVERDGAWLTAAQGGASEIVLGNASALSTETPDECNARWSAGGAPAQLLSRVLTHEFGHVLGLGEDHGDQEAAMFWVTLYCLDLVPTAEEISGSVRP